MEGLLLSLDRDACSQVLAVLPHQSFFGDIPYCSVVTVDRSLFTKTEMFQWFVNGGIFLSYYTLALHHEGIGSCILEHNLFSKSDSELRHQVSIPDNEEIIAVVGFGKYPEEAKCIIADRRPNNQIAIDFTRTSA